MAHCLCFLVKGDIRGAEDIPDLLVTRLFARFGQPWEDASAIDVFQACEDRAVAIWDPEQTALGEHDNRILRGVARLPFVQRCHEIVKRAPWSHCQSSTAMETRLP